MSAPTRPTVMVLCDDCGGEGTVEKRSRCGYEEIAIDECRCDSCDGAKYVERLVTDCEIGDLGNVKPAGRPLIYALYAAEWGVADMLAEVRGYKAKAAAKGWTESVAFWTEVESEIISIYGAEDTEIFEAAQ